VTEGLLTEVVVAGVRECGCEITRGCASATGRALCWWPGPRSEQRARNDRRQYPDPTCTRSL